MLQSYCPNSVIILLSFLWLPSVLNYLNKHSRMKLRRPIQRHQKYYGLQLFKCLKQSSTQPFQFRHATLLPLKAAVLVQQIGAKFQVNCGIYGRSCKFGTQLKIHQMINFSYGPTRDPPPNLHNLRQKCHPPVDQHENEADSKLARLHVRVLYMRSKNAHK